MSALRKHAWTSADYTRAIASAIDKHWHRFGDGAWSRFLDDLLCDLIPGYRHERPLDEHQRKALREITGLYGEAVAACQPFADLLGPIYMDLAGRGHRSTMGQFFTPEAVCDMMAQMSTFDLLPRLRETDRPLTVLEPAVGSGAMLLAVLRIVHAENPDLLRLLDLSAIDLDITCVKMTTIQIAAPLIVHNLELARFAVYHGNALGDPADLTLFVGGVASGNRQKPVRSVPETVDAANETLAPSAPQTDNNPTPVQLALL